MRPSPLFAALRTRPVAKAPGLLLAAALGASCGGGAGLTATGSQSVPAPAITGFDATPSIISPGQLVQLRPVFSNGDGSIDQGVGLVRSGYEVYVGPSATTTYTLTVDNHAGATASKSATVTVSNTKVAILSFTASPNPVPVGATATLTPVFSSNASSAVIDNGVGTVTSGTGYPVQPHANTKYTLTVYGPGGPVSESLTVQVGGS